VFKPAVAATPTSINTASQVAIFDYHRLVDPVRYPGTEITPAVFEAQMKQLQDSGVAVISIAGFSSVATTRKRYSLELRDHNS